MQDSMIFICYFVIRFKIFIRIYMHIDIVKDCKRNLAYTHLYVYIHIKTAGRLFSLVHISRLMSACFYSVILMYQWNVEINCYILFCSILSWESWNDMYVRACIYFVVVVVLFSRMWIHVFSWFEINSHRWIEMVHDMQHRPRKAR